MIVVVGAPIVEEIFYRGLLHAVAAEARLPGGLSVCVTALVFAATHLQDVATGCCCSPGSSSRASSSAPSPSAPAAWAPSIAAHIAFNLVTAVALLVS